MCIILINFFLTLLWHTAQATNFINPKNSNDMETKKTKLMSESPEYRKPAFEIIEIAVEEGFTTSGSDYTPGGGFGTP